MASIVNRAGYSTSTAATAHTVAITLSAGTNRKIVVAVPWKASSSVTAITFDGTSFFANERVYEANSLSTTLKVAIYDYDVPDVKGAASYNVVVTFGANTRPGVYVWQLEGVDAGAPAATNSQETTSSSNNPTGTLTATDGAVLIAAYANEFTGPTIAWTGNVTEYDERVVNSEYIVTSADGVSSGAGTRTATATQSFGSGRAVLAFASYSELSGPGITTQPTAATAQVAGPAIPAVFTVATLAALTAVEWRDDGVAISGADIAVSTNLGAGTSTLTVTPTATTRTGSAITVACTDSNGTTVSSAATLTVRAGTTITSPSTNGSGIATAVLTSDVVNGTGSCKLVTVTHRGVTMRTTTSKLDLEGSTLASSVYALTANGSATTTLTATVYNGGALMAGETVTYTVQRITMNAADSFVSADPTDIDSDGVATSTITVQAAYRADGAQDYVALPGIPASAVVLSAATTTGNTLVQPATATDADGITTGTLKTTDPLTSKTVTATIAGLAATDTAVITTDGGYVPPAPGTPFFEDSFAGTQLNDADGFVWGSLTTGRTSVVSFEGSNAIRFRYGPDADGSDSSAELRFSLPSNFDELWIEYDIWVPTNYANRTQASGGTNNKILRLWGDSYNSGNKIGASTFYAASGFSWNAKMRGERAITAGGSSSASSPTESPDADIADALGEWTQWRWHFKHATSAVANDTVLQFWVNGTLVIDWSNLQAYYDATKPYWNAGYLMGWSNTGFLAQTDFHIRALKFYDTDPGW